MLLKSWFGMIEVVAKRAIEGSPTTSHAYIGPRSGLTTDFGGVTSRAVSLQGVFAYMSDAAVVG